MEPQVNPHCLTRASRATGADSPPARPLRTAAEPKTAGIPA